MQEQNFGTIAALEFCVPPPQGFEDIVEELDIAFQPVGLTRRTLIWDSDDIAIIERDSLRVLLSWVAPLDDNGHGFLILAIGQSPRHSNLVLDRPTTEFVKEVLLDHLGSYLEFQSVFHAEATQPVSTELVDTVYEILCRDYAYPPQTAPQPEPEVEPEAEEVYTESPWYQNIDVAHARAAFERMRQASSSTSRRQHPHEQDLEPAKPEEISLPKRLTIYTLGATMLIYTPPVGASLLVYSTLRDFVPEELQH